MFGADQKGRGIESGCAVAEIVESGTGASVYLHAEEKGNDCENETAGARGLCDCHGRLLRCEMEGSGLVCSSRT